VTLAYLAWAAVCIIWGTTYLAIRIALDTIPPFLMGGLRWTAAGLLLASILKLRRDPFPSRRVWPALALIGILLIGFGNGAVVWAEQWVPSGLTSVMVAMAPFWITGIERLMPNGARLTGRQIVGLLIGFAGIVALVWPEIRFGTGNRFLAGVLATQLACVGWAFGTAYARRRGRDEHVLASVSIQMVAAGVALLIPSVAAAEWRQLSFDSRSFGAFVYLMFIGSIVGFSAYAYALKHLPVATLSLYAYVNPVIAVLLGTIVLREPFNARIAVACAVVLAGTAIVKSAET
jgi:drug/metabolite transporter (DMT)-like permease